MIRFLLKISAKIKLVHIVATAAFVGLVYGLIDVCVDVSDRKENSRYTIGFTVKAGGTAKAGNVVLYIYWVNGVKYDGIAHYDYSDAIVIPNGRYFVEFSIKNPNNGQMLVHKPVPYSIKEAPPEGWDSIPSLPR